MKDRIINISKIIIEDPKKYKQYAKKKIVVNYKNDSFEGTREEYLDDPRLNKDVNSFLNINKNKRLAIHIDSLNRTWIKRLVYNLIMLIFEAGAFFAIPNLSNLILNNLGANASVIGVLNTYLVAGVCGGMLYYVNQKKFYYTNRELENLKLINNEIDRANLVLSESIKYKEVEFENSRERDKIDYHDVIIKNHNRNVDMYYDRQKYRRESSERIKRGVEEDLQKNKNRTSIRNVNLGDLLYYPKTKLNRKQKFKKAIKGIAKWIAEGFEDPGYDESRRRK